MASTIPKYPEQRRGRNELAGGEWQQPAVIGWRHGRKPAPPRGLGDDAKAAWQTWMASWVAGFWEPGDLPGLRVVIRLYDRVAQGANAATTSELRLWLAEYGLTPHGQQQRRWRRPEPVAVESPTQAEPSPYRHLRAVKE